MFVYAVPRRQQMRRVMSNRVQRQLDRMERAREVRNQIHFDNSEERIRARYNDRVTQSQHGIVLRNQIRQYLRGRLAQG